MIEPMAKVEIIGLLEDLDDALDHLQHLGTMQIDEIPTIDGGDHSHVRRIHLDESREKLLAKYEELASATHELLEIIGTRTAGEEPLTPERITKLRNMGPEELSGEIAGIAVDIRRLGRQKKNLVQDLESTRQYESLIAVFLPLLDRVGSLKDFEQLGLILKHGDAAIVPVLRSRVREIAGEDAVVLHQEMTDGRIGVFIGVVQEHLAAVRQLLSNEGVTEHHIPREFRRENLRESIDLIRERMERIPREVAVIDTQLDEERRQSGALLRCVRMTALNRLNQLRVLTRLVRTRYTYVVSGWIPVNGLEQLNRRMNERFGDRVYVGRMRLNDVDMMHIPTQLSNRGLFRAFELLMKLLPPPKYGNMDATPFIAIFFPIFFGIILGDMAYGLLLLTIAGIIRWRSAKGSLLADGALVAMIAGVSTIFFGFLYGEFLGDLGERYGLHPVVPWLHRAAAIEIILLLALALGAAHILLGFSLKVYTSAVMRYMKGVKEGVSKILVILGIVGIFAQLFLGFPEAVRSVSYGVLGLGLLGVLLTEGLIGLLEIFSLLGNILSYSRIMAIGLASVILAIVANRLAEESGNIIAAILIGFIIHLVNFAMGVFSPTIHSLRLHYVEFFSKFFKAEGRPFQPFKRIEEDLS